MLTGSHSRAFSNFFFTRPDPALPTLAFSIVSTDREPGTGYKSEAPRPIWLKFGQIVVRWVTYKTVSAISNSSFHFKVIGYFSLAVVMISHPRIYLLVKMKRRHIPDIRDTVF